MPDGPEKSGLSETKVTKLEAKAQKYMLGGEFADVDAEIIAAGSEAREEMAEHKDEETFLESRVRCDLELVGGRTAFYDTFVQRNSVPIKNALREQYGGDYFRGEKILSVRLLYRNVEDVQRGIIFAEVRRKGRHMDRDDEIWSERLRVEGVN